MPDDDRIEQQLAAYYRRLEEQAGGLSGSAMLRAVESRGRRRRALGRAAGALAGAGAVVLLAAVAIANHIGPLAPSPARPVAPAGGAAPSSARSSPRASGAPVAAPVPLLVADADTVVQIVELVDLSGKVTAVLRTSAPIATVTVGPHHVVLAHDSVLSIFGGSGTKLPDDLFTPVQFSSSPLFNPDGSQWAWSARLDPMAGPTGVYVGTQAVQLRLATTHTDPPGTRLMPLRWVHGKVYLTEQTVVGGGRVLVPTYSGAWVLDPVTGSLTRVAGDACNLQDVADDGTLVCVAQSQQRVTLVRTDGSSVVLSVPGSWQLVGNAHFAPDGRHVVVQAIQGPGAATPVYGEFVGLPGDGRMSAVDGCLAPGFTDQVGPLVDCADGSYRTRSPDGTLRPLPMSAGYLIGVLRDPRD